jgi:predicted MPP superfamily phosphohydrolase
MTTPLFNRRKFLACLGAGGLGLACDVGLFEPFRLKVGRHACKIRSSASVSPVKILHLSDLHASWAVSLGFIQEAVELGLQLKPDLICLTGDFITNQYADFDAYARVLAKLSAAAPAFACLGNHDGGGWSGIHGGYTTTQPVRQLLQQSRIELLHNRCAALRLNGRDIIITGVADAWAENVDLPAAFPASEAGGAATRILLSHNPDTKEFLKFHPWDLLLCGHTHGGQIVLPLLGAPWAPVRDKRFIAGLYSWENRWIHITRGVGNVHGGRFNCPPEVSLVTLV